MVAGPVCPVLEQTPPQTCDIIRSLLDAVVGAAALCDSHFRILHVNISAARMLRVDPDVVVGKDVRSVLEKEVPSDLSTTASTVCEWTGPSLNVRAVRLEAFGWWTLLLKTVERPTDVPEFVGRSAETRELLEFVSRIAASRASSVLLEAETGAGKEVIARRLHALSARAKHAFVAVNCAAMPETLLESELFGYEKGAFTDARSAKPGLIETASGGTLFLDEIGDMPVSVQAKLLRVLEDRTVRRLGGIRDVPVDVRVIGATHRNLAELIEQRLFRSDLYYRLNVVQIRIPPLRERPDDIEELALYLLDRMNELHETRIRGIHPRALQALRSHDWPGNVRELRNVIERAVLVEREPVIMPGSLFATGQTTGKPDPSCPETSAPLCLRTSERELIEEALAQTGWNQTRAAALLGIGRFSLRYRMRKFGLLEATDTARAGELV